MNSSFEQRLMRSPVLPALAAGWLLMNNEPFAGGNTVSLVLMLVCGLWLTTTFPRLSKSGNVIDWLLGK